MTIHDINIILGMLNGFVAGTLFTTLFQLWGDDRRMFWLTLIVGLVCLGTCAFIAYLTSP